MLDASMFCQLVRKECDWGRASLLGCQEGVALAFDRELQSESITVGDGAQDGSCTLDNRTRKTGSAQPVDCPFKLGTRHLDGLEIELAYEGVGDGLRQL